MLVKLSALCDCALSLFIYYLATAVAIIALARISPDVSDYGSGLQVIGAVVVVMFAAVRTGSPAESVMLRLRLPPRFAALAATGAALNVCLASALSLLPDGLTSDYVRQTAGMDCSPAAVLVTAFAVPVAEELLYRGVIGTRLNKAFSAPVAVALTSVIFGLMHVQPLWAVYACAVGVILSAVVLWHRNLLSAVIVHIAFNLTTFILPAGVTAGGVAARAAAGCFAGALTVWLLTGIRRNALRGGRGEPLSGASDD